MVRTLLSSTFTLTLLALRAAAKVDPIHDDLSVDYDGLPQDFQDAIAHQTSGLERDESESGFVPSNTLEKRTSINDLLCSWFGTCGDSDSSGSSTPTTTKAAATPYYTTITTTTNFALYSNNVCYVGDIGYGTFSSESACRTACATRDNCASYTFYRNTCALSTRNAMSYISSYSGAYCGIRDSSCSSYNGGWLLNYYCSNVQDVQTSQKLVTPSQGAKRLRRRGVNGHKKADHSSSVTCRNRETACLVDEDDETYVCRNLLTSVESCGSCGNDCTKSHGSSARCVRGICLSSGGDL